MLTHYFAVGACMAIACFGLIRFTHCFRRLFVIALLGSAALYALVWGPWALQQMNDLKSGDEFLATEVPFWSRAIFPLLSWPFRAVVERSSGQEKVIVFSGILLPISLLMLRRDRSLLPWVLTFWIVPASLLVIDAVRGTVHLSIVRYFAAGSPAVPIWMLALLPFSRRLAILAGVFCVGLALSYRSDRILNESPSFHDIWPALRHRIAPGEPLLVSHGGELQWVADAMLLELSHEPSVWPRPVVRISGAVPVETLSRLDSETAWIVVSDPDRSLEEIVPGIEVIDYTHIGTVGYLYRFRVSTDAE
jgi:hypothetical protein